MKKFILLILVFAIASCGKDKAKEIQKIKEKQNDKYAFQIECIYEKDDSIAVFYQSEGHIQYDKPLSQKIIGSQLPQKITVLIPEGIVPESFTYTVSTNKEQNSISITGISILKNDKMILNGSNYKYNSYFLTDTSFKWNEEKSCFDLTHTNTYPPSLVGSELLKAILR